MAVVGAGSVVVRDVPDKAVVAGSPAKVIKNVAATKMDTVLGHIDFTSPVAAGTDHPVPNVYRAPLSGCQWVKGTKYFTDLAIVDNTDYPAATVTAKTLPMQYS